MDGALDVAADRQVTMRPLVVMVAPDKSALFNPLPEFANSWRHSGPRTNPAASPRWAQSFALV